MPSTESAVVILTALKDAGVDLVASLPDRALVRLVEICSRTTKYAMCR